MPFQSKSQKAISYQLKQEAALIGLRTIADLYKLKKAPHYKIRDRYYKERSREIRRRGARILSAQKVRLAKSGVYKSPILRETKIMTELDIMALVHEEEVLRYNANMK